jgi:oligoribonuclease
MDFLDGPLVWIDCEMTGLDHREDRLLEIAVSSAFFFSLVNIIIVQVIITNGNLEPIDEGIEYVIRTEGAILDG